MHVLRKADIQSREHQRRPSRPELLKRLLNLGFSQAAQQVSVCAPLQADMDAYEFNNYANIQWWTTRRWKREATPMEMSR
mmetsp:Transcript_70525/g.153782  ORF Transcript_70525/g.153782 Transcript_70525/m.153782 type:complete len:80 (+) Transcript_70525:118-357(+)